MSLGRIVTSRGEEQRKTREKTHPRPFFAKSRSFKAFPHFRQTESLVALLCGTHQGVSEVYRGKGEEGKERDEPFRWKSC